MFKVAFYLNEQSKVNSLSDYLWNYVCSLCKEHFLYCFFLEAGLFTASAVRDDDINFFCGTRQNYCDSKYIVFPDSHKDDQIYPPSG